MKPFLKLCGRDHLDFHIHSDMLMWM